MRCLNPILQRLRRCEDTPLDELRKAVLLIVSLGTLTISAAAWVPELLAGRALNQYGVALALLFVATAVGFSWLLLSQRATERLVNYVLVVGFSAGIAIDLALLATNTSAWPILVIVMDMAFVLRVNPRVSGTMVVVGVLWLILTAVESSYRFGLFDLPGSSSQEERYDFICACEKLPCGQHSVVDAASGAQLGVFVLLVDSYVTRGFVSRIDKEMRRMSRAIETVAHIAENLVDFDIEEATRTLQEARGGIPNELSRHFDELILHLQTYRPYLPDSLFEQHAGFEAPLELAHGALDGGVGEITAAIVFTDIRSSSTIWSGCPTGMRLALRTHNKIIRRCITAHRGYEVKTIGDAFMVAFHDLANAVRFSLDVHEKLLAATWPEELLAAPECTRRDGVWGGLALRIGAAYGQVTAEPNELTGRYDYFGHTVNTAARLEAAACVGSVAMLKRDAEGAGLKEAGVADQWAVACTEHIVLKGVSGTQGVDVVSVVPAALEKRGECPHRIDAAGVGSVGEDVARLSTPAEAFAAACRRSTAGLGDSVLRMDSGVESGASSHRAPSTVSGSLSDGDGWRSRIMSALSTASGPGRALAESHRRWMQRAVGQLATVPSGAVCTLTLGDVPNVGEATCDPAVTYMLVSRVLQRVQIALSRTGGSVAAVCGSLLTASWGVVRRNTTHVSDAVEFVGLLASSLQRMGPAHTPRADSSHRGGLDREREGQSPGHNDVDEGGSERCGDRVSQNHHHHYHHHCRLPFHAGICVGPVLTGSIGGTQQRYVTILGVPVHTAARLCIHAETHGALALIGATSLAHSPYQKSELRGSLRAFPRSAAQAAAGGAPRSDADDPRSVQLNTVKHLYEIPNTVGINATHTTDTFLDRLSPGSPLPIMDPATEHAHLRVQPPHRPHDSGGSVLTTRSLSPPPGSIVLMNLDE